MRRPAATLVAEATTIWMSDAVTADESVVFASAMFVVLP
jgi:hypothetical protein